MGDKGLAGDGLWSADVRSRAAAMERLVEEAIGIASNVGYHNRVSTIFLTAISQA